MSDQLAFIHSQFHGGIVGPTGSGKTVVANAIHAGTDRISFFFNSQWKGYVRGETVKYGGPGDNEKIRAALEGGARKFDIRPIGDEQEAHEALTDLLFTLALGGVKVAVFNDEAHDYGATTDSSVHTLHKRGRSPGDQGGAIKVWSISQRYVSFERSARTEMEYLAQVGIPAGADRDALEEERSTGAHAYPFEELEEAHRRTEYQQTVEGGETVSRAFSIERNSKIVFGPTMADPKYAE